MFKLFQGIIFAGLGMVSIEAFSNNTINYYPAAQEIVIPGYSPSSADISTQNEANLTHTEPSRPMDSTSVAPIDLSEKKIATTASGCQDLIPNGMSIDTVKTNMQEQFNYTSMGHTFSWPGQNGQLQTVISFLDTGKPVEATGLYGALANHAKDLNFTLQDALKELPGQAELKGNIYLFTSKDGDGQLIIYTDLKDMVTTFSTTVPCKSKEKPS